MNPYVPNEVIRLRCLEADGNFLVAGRVYEVAEVVTVGGLDRGAYELVGLKGVVKGMLWGLWRFERVAE